MLQDGRAPTGSGRRHLLRWRHEKPRALDRVAPRHGGSRRQRPTDLGQGKVIRVALEYRAPGDGKPNPNFSPKGTQVRLTDLPAAAALPAGAVRPARTGVIEVGPDKTAWIPVLAASDASCPKDLCQLFLDRNRNANFADDGPALTAVPAQREATKAWWTSINKVELSVPYGRGIVERYFVNFWIVREDDAAARTCCATRWDRGGKEP
jgi:hypothetical protein